LSDTRIKFPTIVSGNFVFDIESNDAGGDKDFNDLVLTCTSPASATDYMLYGNVSLYSGFCRFNPCIRRWLVIDTYTQFLEALKVDQLKAAIKDLYPERIPPTNPNPPDPPPFFTPMMINLTDDLPIPQKRVDVFRSVQVNEGSSKKTAAKAAAKKRQQEKWLHLFQTLNSIEPFRFQKQHPKQLAPHLTGPTWQKLPII